MKQARDETRFDGPYGHADLVPIADPTDPRAGVHVVTWLIYGPGYHPFWHYYTLFVVELREHPEFPAPKIVREGATHELDVVSLHPDQEPYDVAKVQSYQTSGKMPWLSPPGVSVQLKATEGEMLELAALGAMSVCGGLLSPEPPFSTQGNWDAWEKSMLLALEHIRTGGHDDG